MIPRCFGSVESDCDESGLDLDFWVSKGSNARSKTLEEWMSCTLVCMPGLSAQNHAAIVILIQAVIELVRGQLGLDLDLSVDPRPLAGSRDLGIEIGVRDTSRRGVIMFQAVVGLPSRPDLRNLVVIRDAVFKDKVGSRSRRDSRAILNSILEIDGCNVHLTSRSGMYYSVFSVSERIGRPLKLELDMLEREFRGNGGALTEGMRYVFRDVFSTMEILHGKGFSLNAAGIDDLFYEAGPHWSGGSVTLGNMGMGLVFDLQRAKCDQGSQKDKSVRMVGRSITEAFVGIDDRHVPADVNRKHLKQLQGKKQKAQSENGNQPCASVSVTGIKPADIAALWIDLCDHPTGHLESGEGRSSGSFSDQAQSSVVLNQARKSEDLRKILLGTLPQFAAEPQQREADLLSAVDKGKAATILFFKNKEQPLATARFGELAHDYLAVSDGTKEVSDFKISAHLALSTPFFPPQQEKLLLSGGLRMPVVRRVSENKAWITKMEKALHSYEDSEDSAPSQVDLVIEEGKGIGVRVVGTWKKGRGKKKRFAGWYVGRAVEGDVPCGGRRYIVSRAKDGLVRCDAEPCEKCPLQWFIEKGIPGPFVNSDSTPTLEVDREAAFVHEGLLWMPMYIVRDFTGFASWRYSLAQDSLRA